MYFKWNLRLFFPNKSPVIQLIGVLNFSLMSLSPAWHSHFTVSWEGASRNRWGCGVQLVTPAGAAFDWTAEFNGVFVCSGSPGAGERPSHSRQRALLCPELRRDLRFSLQRYASVPQQPREGGNNRGELDSTDFFLFVLDFLLFTNQKRSGSNPWQSDWITSTNSWLKVA